MGRLEPCGSGHEGDSKMQCNRPGHAKECSENMPNLAAYLLHFQNHEAGGFLRQVLECMRWAGKPMNIAFGKLKLLGCSVLLLRRQLPLRYATRSSSRAARRHSLG